MAKKKTHQSTASAPVPSDAGQEQKRAAFADFVQNASKVFGEGSIISLDDDSAKDLHLEVIPTGIISVDRALRTGGIPRGRITEILGPESSGKTTLVLHTIAEAQKMGLTNILYVDLEHSLERAHMVNCGVKIEDIYIAYPETGEQAVDMIKDAVLSGADIIVLDSVSALIPKEELEGSVADGSLGGQARLMSKGLRQLPGIVAKSKTAVIYINQIRHKIGVTFGNPETTSGGNALKFYASIRIDMRRIGTKKSGTDAYANEVRTKIIKNKCAPPFGQEEYVMYYDASKTVVSSIVSLGSLVGLIEKSGAWFSYNDQKIGQGHDNAVQHLLDNNDLREEIVLFKKVAAAVADKDEL